MSVVGAIPAGGLGTRIRPYAGLKELLQVGYDSEYRADGTVQTVPRVVAQYALRSLLRANVRNAYIVLSPEKWELFRFFGDGSRFGVRLGYLCQETPRGMPHALAEVSEWSEHNTVAMAMPDTIIEPDDCFVELLSTHRSCRFDLTLGVFPTDAPHRAAPVRVDFASGRVDAVYDKPADPPSRNTWGIAVWEPPFGGLLRDFVRRSTPSVREPILSDAFNLAVSAGLRVGAHVFSRGFYRDIGTVDGLVAARSALEDLTVR